MCEAQVRLYRMQHKPKPLLTLDLPISEHWESTCKRHVYKGRRCSGVAGPSSLSILNSFSTGLWSPFVIYTTFRFFPASKHPFQSNKHCCFILKMHAKAISTVVALCLFASANAQYDDVYARGAAADPNIKSFFKGIGNGLKNMVGLRRRELEELAARDPFLPFLLRAGKGLNGAAGLNQRDLEELEARDPFLPFLLRASKGLKAATGLNQRDLGLLQRSAEAEAEAEFDFDGLNARDLEYLALYGRDAEPEFDDDAFDLYAREPNRHGRTKAVINNAPGMVNAGANAYQAVQGRDAYADPDTFDNEY